MKGHRSPYIVLFFAAFFYSGKLIAQTPAGHADAETMKLISEASDQKGKETGALIILKDYLMTVDEKGETKMVIRVLGKIYSQEALADYSTIPLSYNSFYEEPTLNYARVIQKDGTIRDVPKDAIQIKTIPESEGLQYSDSRYLSFALSGMVIGASFDYQITFIQKEPQMEGEWFDNHWFAGMLQNLSPPHQPRIDPVAKSRYTLILPKGTKFKYHLYSSNAEPVIENIGNQDSYKWIFTDLRSIKIEESMPDLSKLSPVLIIGSLESWSQVDQWAAKKILTKVEISSLVSSKAKELTEGKESDIQKIKAISEFIQTDIRYVYADLNRGGYTPHTVNEILNSKYGDCKDKSVLLISILKAVGIQAYPALIDPYPYGDFSEIPSGWFSHMITYIPLTRRDIWLDPTSEVTPFPDLTVTDQGRTAFIINGRGGILTKTPLSPAEENLSVFEMKTSFKERSALISMKLSCKGLYNDIMKSIFKQIDPDSRTEAIKKLITNYIESANFDNIKLSDVNNPQSPFSFEINFKLDTIWKKGQGIFGWGSYTQLPLSLLANVDAQSFSAKRNNDIINPIPYKIEGTEIYFPPERDLLPIKIPANDSVKNDYIGYSQVFKREGKAITLHWTFSDHGVNIPADKYDYYVKSIKSLKEKLKWSITYVDPVEYVSAFLKNENPYNTLTYCTQTLKDDPKNVLALLLRGATCDKLKQDDQAAKAFREALDLAPDNKYAILFITYSAQAKRNPIFVLSHINQALGEDPEFESALLDRAYYFSERKENEKAMNDINKVLNLNPKSLRGYTLKGTVLFKTGKRLQSLEAYEEALNIDTTNISLCNYLAQNYLAIGSARKAIKLLNRAMSMDAENAGTIGNLGWAWYISNDDQKCIEYSKKAITINPKTYFARFNLALATLRSGNISEARKLYSILKDEAKYITLPEIDGAKKDLNELMARGKNVNEIKSILAEFF